MLLSPFLSTEWSTEVVSKVNLSLYIISLFSIPYNPSPSFIPIFIILSSDTPLRPKRSFPPSDSIVPLLLFERACELLFVPSILKIRFPSFPIVILFTPVTSKLPIAPLESIVFSYRVTFVFLPIFIFSKLDILCIIFISWLSDEFDLAPELIPKLRVSLSAPPSRVPLSIVPAPIIRVSAPPPISIFPLTIVFWIPLLPSVYSTVPDCSISVSPLPLPDIAKPLVSGLLSSIPPFTIVPDKVSWLLPSVPSLLSAVPNTTAVP